MVRAMTLVTMCAAALLVSGSATLADAPKLEIGKETAIFNGKDLTGWEVMGSNKDAFYVKDGAIWCNGQGGYWLRFTEELSDFRLKMKYMVTPNANSGVFIRSAKEGDPPFTGWEIQILDTHGKDPNKHSAGAIYDVITPMREMSKPAGEWNDLEALVIGPFVRIWLNGFKIIDVNFNDLTQPIGKFSVAYKDMPRSGYIGFQDHGNEVAFKDITVTTLPAPTGQVR